MKRIFATVTMVVLAAIFVVTPVLAGAGRTMEAAIKQPTRMFMTATITDVTAAGDIVVKIYMTNRAFIEYRGKTVDVEINNYTLCLDWVNQRKDKLIPIDCGTLGEDEKVNIKAKVTEDVNGQVTILAKRVVRQQRSIRH